MGDAGSLSPNSAKARARARKCMPGGNTRTTVHVSPGPPYLVRGEGYVVTDADGHRLVDFQNNYTALVHGHSEPSITEAGQRALALGASFGLPTLAEVELAELLSARVPSAPRWRFTNSGTEAVMFALRAARAFTGRTGVVRFAGSYHGTYDDVMGPGPGIRLDRGGGHVLPLADGPALQSVLRSNGDDIAAVVLDLMPNRSGLRPLPQSFVDLAVREADAAGALLIVDEVMSFRLRPGGFQEAYGLRPDLTSLGKVIGGGMPVGAFGGRVDVMNQLDPELPAPIQHGGTFNANPVVMQMGIASLNRLDTETIDRINDLGDRLRQGIGRTGFEITGSGSLVRILGQEHQAQIWWRLYRAGILTCVNGLMAVSTVMDEDVIDTSIELINRELSPLRRKSTKAPLSRLPGDEMVVAP